MGPFVAVNAGVCGDSTVGERMRSRGDGARGTAVH